MPLASRTPVALAALSLVLAASAAAAQERRSTLEDSYMTLVHRYESDPTAEIQPLEVVR